MTTTPNAFDEAAAPTRGAAGVALPGSPRLGHRPLRSLGTWLLSLLAIAVVLDLFMVASAGDLLVALSSVGTEGAEAQLLAAEMRLGLLAVLRLLLGAITAAVFLVWFHRAYRNLPCLGIPSRRFGTGWAVGAWFVPFLNLVRPMEIAKELWLASDAGARADDARTPGPIHVWWALFLVAGGLGTGAAASFALSDPGSSQLGATAIDMAAVGVRALAGIAALVVVHGITAGQGLLTPQDALAPDPSHHGPPNRTVAIVAAASVAGLLTLGAWLTRPTNLEGAESALHATQSEAVLAETGLEGRGTDNEHAELATPEEVTGAERVEVVESTTVWVDELQVGHCFDDPPEDDLGVGEVVVVSCEQPHDNEVYALVEVPGERDAPYPDETRLAVDSEEACRDPFADYVGTPYEDSSLWLWAIYPDSATWLKGDRVVVCVLIDGDLAKLVGSMANTGR